MSDLLWFALTIIVSTGLGLVFHKLKIPMGAMVGAMIAAAILNIYTMHGVFYENVRTALQISTGAMIGSRIGKDEAKSMKSIIFATIILITGMVGLNILFGTAVFRFSELDIVTSLFAVTPGGASDMAVISADLGADTAYVAIMQMLRIIFIITTLPLIFKYVVKKTHYTGPQVIDRTDVQLINPTTRTAEVGQESQTGSFSHLPSEPFRYNKREIMLLIGLFMIATIGGVGLKLLSVPAGSIIGAMILSIFYSIFCGKAVFPTVIRPYQQILAGAYIGVSIDMDTIKSLNILLIPAVIMFIGIICFVFGLSYIIHKLTKLDFVTCLLASTPGGITEMSLLSEDFGADTPKIAIMQTTRLVLVILLFPSMIQIILAILG
ncbi:MAG: AbrB family transcriptional regulator [Oscillospiraceae bacterium]|nr:AbrB family transcriptional regulator [Oscillospiraceae bacterium]